YGSYDELTTAGNTYLATRTASNVGNVGIGTASPVVKFQVTSPNASDTLTLGSPSGGFYLTNLNPNYGLLGGVFSNGRAWLQAGRTDGATTAYDLILQSAGGNVGIGTPAPSGNFNIRAGVPQLTAALTDAGTRQGFLSIDVNNSVAGSGGAVVFGNQQSIAAGSLGMAAIKALLTDGSGNTRGDLAFSTRNAAGDTALTERIRILANGNVGIGVSPAQKLQVAGNIDVNSLSYRYGFFGRSDLGLIGDGNYSLSLNAPEGITINIDSNNNTTATPFQIREGGVGPTGGSLLVTVLENGNVGIGTAAPPAAKLEVSGSLNVTQGIKIGSVGGGATGQTLRPVLCQKTDGTIGSCSAITGATCTCN
ncbi:MAG: hypothetical protein Q8N85_04675, partial [Candidatus Omnitrophota bacterium]|nr:hypothetical protein [Candidatus Omnitrophota bacterium]